MQAHGDGQTGTFVYIGFVTGVPSPTACSPTRTVGVLHAILPPHITSENLPVSGPWCGKFFEHSKTILSQLQFITLHFCYPRWYSKFISLFRTLIHPVCPFGANEVHASSAMPHSMPTAVRCELCAMQTMELRRTFGSLFTSGGGNCRSGPGLIDTMCFKVTFRV